ncbi:MAG: acyl-CoA synthetase [Gammaproteobacteria bacterium]|nr:acyl-CoA synthetase [Gammaproteobacteria bacterium]
MTDNLLNIAFECVAAQAKKAPGKRALIVVGEDLSANAQLTFSELNDKVARLANGLKSLNIPQGSRCLIRSPKNVDFLLLFFAAMGVGLVPISSLSNLSEDEQQFILNDATPLLFYQHPDIELSLQVGEDCRVLTYKELQQLKTTEYKPLSTTTHADDPAFITYTSGSTAAPKGVIHAHRTLLGREPLRQYWLGLQSTDIVLHSGKPCWTYSMGVGFLDTWVRGATALVYLGKDWGNSLAELISAFKVTLLASSPMYYRELDQAKPLPRKYFQSLRLASSAGEKLSQAVIDRWIQHYAVPLYEALGMSEMSTFISFGSSVPPRAGSVGKIQPGRKVEILPVDGGIKPVKTNEVGVLALHRSNPGFMLGYLNRSDEMQKQCRGDWFISGDLMYKDKDDYLWYVGRCDDILNVAGGHRVSPLEIELVIRSHPLVKNAVCHYGSYQGLDNYLLVSIEPLSLNNTDRKSATAIHRWCKEKLSANKVPALIVFVESIPKKATDKVDRKAIDTAKQVSSVYAFIAGP